MKRTWTYLAFLPFTAAMGLTGAKAEEMAKAGAWGEEEVPEDEADGKSSSDDNGEESEAGAQSEAKAPSLGGAEDGGAGYAGTGGYSPALDTGYVNPIGPPIVHDGSMYMPAGGGYGPAFHHGGGGSVYVGGSGGGSQVIQKTVYTKAVGPGWEYGSKIPAPSDGIPLDESGYVEPDPQDADAMMILLGGLAEGVGEGAESSGEIVFDIVDYGAITIGYGYAFYGAAGSEDAFADTFATVSGADMVFSYHDSDSHGPMAYSTTHVVAIDFEGQFEPSNHNDLGEVFWRQLLADGPFEPWDIQDEDNDVSVDGNTSMLTFSADLPGYGSLSAAEFATLAFDSIGSSVNFSLGGDQSNLQMIGEAQGVETLTSAQGSVIEITDQFSSVSGLAVGVA